MVYNKNIPMIFQKNNNSFYSVNIISNNFESSTEFLFKKDSQDFITSFIMADITKELSEVKGEMTRTKNKLDSLKDDDKETNLSELPEEIREAIFRPANQNINSEGGRSR